MRTRQALRWLYPGMRVKRWTILAAISMSLVLFALLEAVGKAHVVKIYLLLPQQAYLRHLVVAFALAIGATGFFFSLYRLVRSVARAIAPGRADRPSQIIYRTRVLRRGPHVVALGGGTGLSTLLRGLKEETSNITGVVTVMDDGGSSGRLRTELDVLPPGDIRNCILALAEDEERMARLFQHRFWGKADLAGHSLGNLLLVGLEQATGGFDRAVEEMSYILNVRGKVLPATLERTHLRAQMEDSEWVEGESHITADPRRIVSIELSKTNVAPYYRVLDAISTADLILLGPGSLFTSVVPNLLVDGIADAIEAAAAEKMLIGNLMTQSGETDGFSLSDHLAVLSQYIDLRVFDSVLVNRALPPDELLAGYREESSEPVRNDLSSENDYQISVISADLLGFAELEGKQTVKHDPRKLARAIARHARAFTRH